MITDPIRRAERALRLLDDPLVREAREHMQASLTRAMWARHKLSDAEQAKLDAYVRHYGDFFAWFERVVADGKVAEADIQSKNKIAQLAERVRNRL